MTRRGRSLARGGRLWRRMIWPFVALEAGLEWLVHRMRRWALLKFLQLIAAFSVVVGVVSYLRSADERERQGHFEAWQVISAAYGQRGSGGRHEALEALNRDGVSLMGIDLSGAMLADVRLPGARLAYSILDSTIFDGATLTGTQLVGSSLEGASLVAAEITGGDLGEARLRGAYLQRAVLDGASLTGADLTGAHLMRASLRNAVLFCADVKRAQLQMVDLRGANLSALQHWREILSLYGANVFGVELAPPGFLEWARDTMGAVSIAADSAWQATREKPFRVLSEPVTDEAQWTAIREREMAAWNRTKESWPTPPMTFAPGSDTFFVAEIAQEAREALREAGRSGFPWVLTPVAEDTVPNSCVERVRVGRGPIEPRY